MSMNSILFLMTEFELAKAGIVIVDVAELSERDREWLQDYFLLHVFPGADAARGRSGASVSVHSQSRLHAGAEARSTSSDGAAMNALVRFPNKIERFVKLPDTGAGGAQRFVTLEQIIVAFSAAAVSRLQGDRAGQSSASSATATSKSRRRPRTWCGSSKAR